MYLDYYGVECIAQVFVASLHDAHGVVMRVIGDHGKFEEYGAIGGEDIVAQRW